MDLRRNTGVAKAGLTTGIIGTTLGALNMVGNGLNGAANLMNAASDNCGGTTVLPVAVPMNSGWGWGNGWNGGFNGNWGGNWNNEWGCSENHHVNRYELGLQQQIAEKDSQIALRDANTYNDQKNLEMYKYIDGRLRDIEKELCAQAVVNQATKDSFQLVQQEQKCCCDRLEQAIKNEAQERRCADRTIINYVNATFYPKMVADVTTGTTTTAQTLYNPLPIDGCCCGNSSQSTGALVQ